MYLYAQSYVRFSATDVNTFCLGQRFSPNLLRHQVNVCDGLHAGYILGFFPICHYGVSYGTVHL